MNAKLQVYLFGSPPVYRKLCPRRAFFFLAFLFLVFLRGNGLNITLNLFNSLSFKDAEKVATAAAKGHEEQLPHEASNTAVDESLPESEETTAMEAASGQEAESSVAPAPKRKAVRGRQAKNVNVKSAEEEKVPKDPSVPASVRGRRGKQAEVAAPPAVRQATRGRNAKAAEIEHADLETEKVEPQPAKVALKPKRGRAAKAAEATQDIQAETVIEPVAETSEAGIQEKMVVKPRRGRGPGQSVQNKLEEEPVAPAERLPPTGQTKGANFFFSLQL